MENAAEMMGVHQKNRAKFIGNSMEHPNYLEDHLT
jgi:hypothetical protein